MSTPAAADWRWCSFRSTAATDSTLDPPSVMASSSGTAASSPLIPSSCFVWYQLPPHTTHWRSDIIKGQVLVWPPLFLVCCATPPRHCLFQWLSWSHSSDGSQKRLSVVCCAMPTCHFCTDGRHEDTPMMDIVYWTTDPYLVDTVHHWSKGLGAPSSGRWNVSWICSDERNGRANSLRTNLRRLVPVIKHINFFCNVNF